MSTKVSIEFFLPDHFLVTLNKIKGSKSDMLRKYLIDVIGRSSGEVQSLFTIKLLQALSECNINISKSFEDE